MDYEAFYQKLRDPDFIPGYEVLQKIGGGVFGEVFKVRKKSISRIYVIKFLKLDHEAQREVIEKELASLRNFAQIDHPNLVGIEDQGSVHEIPYIIMTFAGDQTLQDRLREVAPDGGMDREEILSTFDQILSGVAALHQRSIVHFDLKPANIFLRDGTVRVGDYGLSKMLSESRQSLSFGRGTPYYMAPEVMRRKGDLRADVYSLGAILFELATGTVPFDGDSDWEVLRKHEVDPVNFPPRVDEDLRALIDRAMAKDPDDRFQDAKQFRGEFRQRLGLDPVTKERATTVLHVPDPAPAASPSTTAERVNQLSRTATARLESMARQASGPLLANTAAPAFESTATAQDVRPPADRAYAAAAPQAPVDAEPGLKAAPGRPPKGRFLSGILALLAAAGLLLVLSLFVFQSRRTPAPVAPVEPQPIVAPAPETPRTVSDAATPPQTGPEGENYGKALRFLHFLLNDKRKMPPAVQDYFNELLKDSEDR